MGIEDYRPVGHVSEKTKNNISLAWSLGYVVIISCKGAIMLYRRKYYAFDKFKLKLVGVCYKHNYFSYLKDRHQLVQVDDARTNPDCTYGGAF
jgi:hypothetical protein